MDVLLGLLATMSLELKFMLVFIPSYAVAYVNNSERVFFIWINKIIYGFTGLLITYYSYGLPGLADQKPYMWITAVVAVIIAKDVLTAFTELMRQVLPQITSLINDIMELGREFAVHYVTEKLERLKKSMMAGSK